MRRDLSGGMSGQGESQLMRNKSQDLSIAYALTCSYGIPQIVTVPNAPRLAAGTLPSSGD